MSAFRIVALVAILLVVNVFFALRVSENRVATYRSTDNKEAVRECLEFFTEHPRELRRYYGYRLAPGGPPKDGIILTGNDGTELLLKDQPSGGSTLTVVAQNRPPAASMAMYRKCAEEGLSWESIVTTKGADGSSDPAKQN